MSFYDDVRAEILSVRLKNDCCKVCEAYAYLLFCNVKTRSCVRIKYQSEEEALYFRSLFKRAFEIQSDIIINEGKFILMFELMPEPIIKALLNCMIDSALFKCGNCLSAFIRGAFLACGKISNPEKEYHAEFIFKNERLAYSFLKAVKDVLPLCKLTERNRKFVVYLKDSESIENMLAAIGAQSGAMNTMQAAIFKDIRNHENRLNNFANANLKKTTDSGYKYLRAIETLEKQDALPGLPDDLQNIAFAKRDNIEMSLNELAELLNMSRSTVYRGLNKLVKLADRS